MENGLKVGGPSYWGKVDYIEEVLGLDAYAGKGRDYAECEELLNGIVAFVSTPSHGGFGVLADRAAEILTPAAIRVGVKSGAYLWYEEDCKIAVVLHCLHYQGHIDYQRIDMATACCKRWEPEYLAEFDEEVRKYFEAGDARLAEFDEEVRKYFRAKAALLG